MSKKWDLVYIQINKRIPLRIINYLIPSLFLLFCMHIYFASLAVKADLTRGRSFSLWKLSLHPTFPVATGRMTSTWCSDTIRVLSTQEIRTNDLTDVKIGTGVHYKSAKNIADTQTSNDFPSMQICRRLFDRHIVAFETLHAYSIGFPVRAILFVKSYHDNGKQYYNVYIHWKYMSINLLSCLSLFWICNKIVIVAIRQLRICKRVCPVCSYRIESLTKCPECGSDVGGAVARLTNRHR